MTPPGAGSDAHDDGPETGGDQVARSLQAGLSPEAVATIEGFTVQTRYRSGGPGDVGGDWYDVVAVDDAGVMLVIGDIAGRGIDAAVSMAKLRYAALAYLFEDQSPGSVLTRMSRLTPWALPGEVATVALAWLPSGRDDFLLASAGHPPPLMLDGADTAFLAPPRGPALGLQPATYAEQTHSLPPGAALVLYTDGLVERRGEPIDAGLQRLARTAAEAGDDAEVCDRIVSVLPDRPGGDDLALVMVRRNKEA